MKRQPLNIEARGIEGSGAARSVLLTSGSDLKVPRLRIEDAAGPAQ
jgi:hypothetical protein